MRGAIAVVEVLMAGITISGIGSSCPGSVPEFSSVATINNEELGALYM